MSATRPTTRHYPQEFDRRKWPVKLIAGILLGVATSNLVCLYAGTEFGRAIEREAARLEAQKANAKRTSATARAIGVDCGFGYIEYRRICSGRARSEATILKAER